MNGLDFSSIGASLAKSKSQIIFLPQNLTVDNTAAGLALYLALKQLGKSVSIATSESVPVGLNRLIGIDKIVNQVGSRNLVISFDYVQDSIEKVSYNIDKGKFNLVIEPKEGFPALDSNKVEYSYKGSGADLLIVIGSSRLENIGRLYMDEQKMFTAKEIANIDISPLNTRYGKTNLINSQSSSLSELSGLIIKNLGLPVNADIATNILTGIDTITNGLSVRTGASTFEIVSWCMSQGGRRAQGSPAQAAAPFDTRPYMPPTRPAPFNPQVNQSFTPRAGWAGFNQPYQNGQNFYQPQQPSQQPYQQPAQPPAWQPPSLVGQPPVAPLPQYQPFNQPNPVPQPWQPPVQAPQQPQSIPAMQPSFPSNSNQGFEEPLVNQSQQQQVPSPDWLKPKIYKGSTQV